MTLETLNKRIKTTTDLREIVSTMKILSSVSIGPYEKALASLKEYAQTVQDAFLGAALNDALIKPNLPKQNDNQTLIILIGTDNGLVGKFNRDVLSYTKTYLNTHNIDPEKSYYLCVGKRLCALAQNAFKTQLKGCYPISNSLKEIGSIASTLLIKINEILSTISTHQVLVFYNHKESGHAQEPKMDQLMPLPYDQLFQLKKQKWQGRSFPMMPDAKQGMISGLTHEYLTIILTRALTASLAAEHYARMINMQQAEKNIDKSLEEMNLAYQQARQTQITDELIDIVSGAQAMKQKKTLS